MDESPVNVLPKDVQTGSTRESDRQGCPRIKHSDSSHSMMMLCCGATEISIHQFIGGFRNNLTKQV